MTLTADLALRRGTFSLAARFELASGEVTALCGPSGAGKTTILRCIAGLTRADSARVEVGGRVWEDSARRLFVPVHERGVGYVFQDVALFPHLSVRQNLEYPLRHARSRSPHVELSRLIEWLELAPLLERDSRSLSGGERQRVAIGRALAASPEVLLLDEPLAALDAEARAEILARFERLFAELEVPVLYVSHARDEVARLARRVLAIEAGTLVAEP
jgi:molybdate transport system ATP-binding protein